ncbi:GNAT family N-acetyltransferase [Paenibacillus caui]|uniref:GNAT family N-acetyltransferase n=1 Tax=Paenibacillus caui TaxID=2873927 RepID=UPI001EFFAE38|nr:GNAT family N-acetyltransferase [Paenibacillus caui]
MGVVLEPVTAGQSDILHNLMQLYFYDFTAFLDIQLEENGRFQPYPGLDKYVAEHGNGLHQAFIIRSSGQIAGFALVDQLTANPEGDYYMAEFFVVRRFRRRGVGRQAAMKLFGMFQGRWFVSQVANNTPAQAFWRSTIAGFTGGVYTEKVRPISGNIVQFFNTEK